MQVPTRKRRTDKKVQKKVHAKYTEVEMDYWLQVEVDYNVGLESVWPNRCNY